MKALMIALLALAAPAGAALAQAPACGGVEQLARPEFPLARVAASIKARELNVTVVGSASSTLAPQAGSAAPYPKRLEAALAEMIPGVKVKVTVHARPKRTAADMAEDFGRILQEEKPSLVIWQTGTVEAMQGIDPDAFRATLEEGIETLHTGGADALLINMQFSPRTESIIAVNTYVETFRFVAMQQQVPLFDRFSIMKQWNELGVFDLYAATREFAQAMRVHECLGRLLAGLVVEAAAMSEDANPLGKTAQ